MGGSGEVTEVDREKIERANEQFEIAKANVAAFRSSLVANLSAATEPITPKVAFKIPVYREALSWRTIELAQGTIDALADKNILAAALLCRSVLECSAAYHYLDGKLAEVVNSDSVESLNSTIMKLLMGSRWQDWNHQSINVLTMIGGAEKDMPGIRQNYDSLSEMCHPNYSGTAMLFSDPMSGFDIALGPYVRAKERSYCSIVASLSGALALFECFYNSCAGHLPRVVELCSRDLETINRP